MAGALAGIRVIDMTRVVAGPLAGQTLGDLGAEVIKVERLGEGDDIRSVGPPWTRDPKGRDTSTSTYFQTVNRNKRSIALDFATQEGADLVRRLAGGADVLIENYRTGTLARYGLGYEDLRKINPRLVYCSVTGFGQTGPYANRSGYDYLIQAMGGVMGVTGPAEGEPGAEPMRVGIPLADIFAGMNAVIGILAAIRRRDISGEGQQVDIALLDSQVAALLNHFVAWLNNGEEIARSGNHHPSAAPYGPFPTSDGRILIATFNDREFARLAPALDRACWLTDERFATLGLRVENRKALAQELAGALKHRTNAEWIDRLNAARVSCGPINTMSDIENDPQIQARGMIVTLPHPELGQIRLTGSPLRLSASPVEYRCAPPAIGQDTDAILHELLGLDDAAVARLRAGRVI